MGSAIAVAGGALIATKSTGDANDGSCRCRRATSLVNMGRHRTTRGTTTTTSTYTSTTTSTSTHHHLRAQPPPLPIPPPAASKQQSLSQKLLREAWAGGAANAFTSAFLNPMDVTKVSGWGVYCCDFLLLPVAPSVSCSV